MVGERNRTVHLVPTPNTETIPGHLTAHCGMQFAPGTIELLNEPHGMPRVRCVATVPISGVDHLPGGAVADGR
jgi:hypothetical protein